MPNPNPFRPPLPHGDYLGVRVYSPHGCGGYYMVEAWLYGAHGRIGRWMDA